MPKPGRSLPGGIVKTTAFSNVTLAVSLLYFALFLGYTHVNYSHIVLDDPFRAALFYAPAACVVLLLLSVKLSAEHRVGLSLLSPRRVCRALAAQRQAERGTFGSFAPHALDGDLPLPS